MSIRFDRIMIGILTLMISMSLVALGQLGYDKLTAEGVRALGISENLVPKETGKLEEIQNAKVKAADAEKFAEKAFSNKCGGRGSFERAYPAKPFCIGYDIDGFAKKGAALWQVKVYNTIEVYLLAVIWVHPETGQVYFVCGMWDEEKPVTNSPPSQKSSSMESP